MTGDKVSLLQVLNMSLDVNDNSTTILFPSTDDSNTSLSPILPGPPPCKIILTETIKDSRVRIWDLAILIPNTFFMLFLLLRIRQVRRRLQQSNSPIFLAFLVLVFMNVLVGTIRSVVSMLVNASVEAGDITDKVLWLFCRFFILFTEMSVLVFGLAFGHLDSRSSIKRVVLVTSATAFIYSGIQGVLEIAHPDPMFQVASNGRDYNLFAHGGMIFWCVSSICFTLVYFSVFILPYTPIRHKVPLPVKRSFYVYCFSLGLLNLIQCSGSILLIDGVEEGMCMVDLSTFLYFTLFTPLVYKVFLSEFFGSVNLNILFSYKSQQDDVDEDHGGSDHLSLPNQPNSSPSSSSAPSNAGKTIDSASSSEHHLYSNSALFDSTHFTSPYQSPSNQFYNHQYSNPPHPTSIRKTGNSAEDSIPISSPLDIDIPNSLEVHHPTGGSVPSPGQGLVSNSGNIQSHLHNNTD